MAESVWIGFVLSFCSSAHRKSSYPPVKLEQARSERRGDRLRGARRVDLPRRVPGFCRRAGPDADRTGMGVEIITGAGMRRDAMACGVIHIIGMDVDDWRTQGRLGDSEWNGLSISKTEGGEGRDG